MAPLEKLLQIRILFPCSPIANNFYKFAKASLYIHMRVIWRFSVSMTLLDWKSNIKPVFWHRLHLFKTNRLIVLLQVNPNSKIMLLKPTKRYFSSIWIFSICHVCITFSEIWSEAFNSIICAHVISVAIASYHSYSYMHFVVNLLRQLIWVKTSAPFPFSAIASAPLKTKKIIGSLSSWNCWQP